MTGHGKMTPYKILCIIYVCEMPLQISKHFLNLNFNITNTFKTHHVQGVDASFSTMLLYSSSTSKYCLWRSVM